MATSPAPRHRTKAAVDAGPEETLGHLLWEVSARMSVLGESALAGTRLTFPSLGLLELVANDPGVTIASLSRRVPRTQQAISQIMSRLEKLGYIERRLGPGRGVGLHITEPGSAALAEGMELERDYEHHLRDLLGEDRYTQLLVVLDETNRLLGA